MPEKKRFVIVLNWSNADPSVYGPFSNEQNAEKALKRIRRGWNSRDWYKSNSGGDIVELKPVK